MSAENISQRLQVSIPKKLLTGDGLRPSRLHSMNGTFIGVRGILTDLPQVTSEIIVRMTSGKLPELPWIPYPAIDAIRKVARKDWKVLESGSGMSTLWWGKHLKGGEIDAIECDAQWFEGISKMVSEKKLDNVHLHFTSESDFADLTQFPDHAYNMLVIDGHTRKDVATQALQKMDRNKQAYIYLDDTDQAKEWPGGDFSQAEKTLKSLAKSEGGTLQYFTGLKPASAAAAEGLLITLPAHK